MIPREHMRIISPKYGTHSMIYQMTTLEGQNTITKKLRHVKIQVIRCLLFILPAINWSLPNWATDPLLSEPVVNGLMLGEAYTCVYQSIRNICG